MLLKCKKRIFTITLILFLSSSSMAEECVVLLHGFGSGGGSSFQLNRINTNLKNNGYRTLTIDYPSRSLHVFQLAEQFVLPKIRSELKGCSKVHFIGYSMGGIITRYIIDNYRPKNLGRVVFIATPNSGVEAVSVLGKYTWFQSIFGPAVQDIATGSAFLESLSKNVDYEAGVISGNFSINPFTSLFLIPGDDDGTISVETSKIKGMKDHLVVNSSHYMLLYNEQVIEETEYFIRNGSFRH